MQPSEQTYRAIYEAYGKATFEDKKFLILDLLAEIKTGNETLERIFEYLRTNRNVVAEDLDEVMQAVIMANIDLDEEKRRSGVRQLEISKRKFEEIKLREEAEADASKKEALQRLETAT